MVNLLLESLWSVFYILSICSRHGVIRKIRRLLVNRAKYFYHVATRSHSDQQIRMRTRSASLNKPEFRTKSRDRYTDSTSFSI